MRSVLTPGSSSGRRLSRRAAVPVGALLALGVAVLIVVSSAGGSNSHHAAVHDPASTREAAPGPAALGGTDSRARLRLAARREAHEIRRVLRYTPFVADGIPRHRVIALTFDDGPGPYTEQIVRILVRMHAPATFFIVGEELDYFSAGLRAELAHGFVVGDHTETHPWLAHLDAAAQYGQIHDDAVRIERLGGPYPRLFRPPYGFYDRQTMATLRRLHMLMVLWSIDPGDWRLPGVGAIVASVLSAARPGAIVIMHDGGGDRSQTVAALPAIIRGLRRRRYRLVNVPQLLRLDPPPRHQRLPSVGE